jgi:hypothetical protein
MRQFVDEVAHEIDQMILLAANRISPLPSSAPDGHIVGGIFGMRIAIRQTSNRSHG